MFFDPLPLPPRDAAVLARIIGFLRGNNVVNNIRDTIRAATGIDTTPFLYPKISDRPAWGYVRIGQNVLVYIDGISDLAQARLVMNGYAGNIQSGYSNPGNSTLLAWAVDIRNSMEQNTLWQSENLTIAGWSAGGAVAPLINAYRMIGRTNDATVRIISFGAPRASGTGIANVIRQSCTASRYMAFNDPIPNFPPRSGTFTWVPFVVGIRASVRFANFVHHYGGLVVDGAGNVFNAEVPTHGDITPRVALDAYWNGLSADSFSPHSLENYANLLSLGSASPPNRSHSQFTPAEHTLNQPPQEIQRQVRTVNGAVRELQARQESVPVVIPRARLARAIRQGKVFYVVINDVPTMMTPTRKRAQGLARALNAFLRRNQSTAYVDPVALTEQIQLFLNAATDASSGIKPTLSTNIPV